MSHLGRGSKPGETRTGKPDQRHLSGGGKSNMSLALEQIGVDQCAAGRAQERFGEGAGRLPGGVEYSV